MKKISLLNNAVREAIKVLKQGGLVIAPSDTVYGLLVDATSKEGVEKLLIFKNRPIGKPISVFVSDFSMLQNNVEAVNHETLLHELLPGPFTIVLPSKQHVVSLLESERKTLGVRIPDYSFINELVASYGKPITATSANISGKPPHYSIDSLLKQIPKVKEELVDLVIDAGKLPHNKPSTVIDLTKGEMKIMRQGDIVFNQNDTYTSESPSQTKKLGQYIFKKYLNKSNKPLIMLIEGDLGAGKTMLVKGVGEMLDVSNIISPTFVVYYEYDVMKDPVTKFIHFDLYNVEDETEFKYLGIEEMLKPGTILCIEWGERSGALINLFKQKAEIIYVKIKYLDKKKREIEIKH